MKKPFFIVILLVLVLGLNLATPLQPDGINSLDEGLEFVNFENPLDSNPGTGTSGQFRIHNTHTELLTGIGFSNSDVNGPGGAVILSNEVGFSPALISSLDADQNSEFVTYTVNIPSGQTPGLYQGTLTAQDFTTNYSGTIDFSFAVNQLIQYSVSGLDSDDELIYSLPEDDTQEETIRLTNTGNVDLTNMRITLNGDFTDSDDNEASFRINNNAVTLGTPYSVGTITIGSSTELDIEVSTDNGIRLETYTGTATIESTTYPGITFTFPVNVRVEPELCKDGRVSDGDPVGGPNSGNIRIDIQEPDDGDDFKIGEEMDIEVNIDNTDDNDMDIALEAILYNIDEDEEVENIEVEEEEVEEGKDEDFKFELTIPFDEDLDTDDTFILYIKAFEDGDEDENCNYDSIEIEIERESHEVVITDFQINPSVVSCGDTVSFTTDVLNVGEKDEDDVKVSIIQNTLGINLFSEIFDLEKHSDKDNDAVKTFSYKIPEDASEGSHLIQAKVTFDGSNTNSVFQSLTIQNCDGTVSGDVLSLPQTSYTTTIGSSFSVGYIITNTGSTSETYTVEVTPSGSWASPVTESVTVSAGQSTT